MSRNLFVVPTWSQQTLGSATRTTIARTSTQIKDKDERGTLLLDWAPYKAVLYLRLRTSTNPPGSLEFKRGPLAKACAGLHQKQSPVEIT